MAPESSGGLGLEKIERLFILQRTRRGLIVKIHKLLMVVVIGRPSRQPFSVGIPRGRKVDPEGRHLVRDLPIHSLLWPAFEVEMIENIDELDGVVENSRPAGKVEPG